jgi:hypothetical protein
MNSWGRLFGANCTANLTKADNFGLARSKMTDVYLERGISIEGRRLLPRLAPLYLNKKVGSRVQRLPLRA